jgi:hypothetical protein
MDFPSLTPGDNKEAKTHDNDDAHCRKTLLTHFDESDSVRYCLIVPQVFKNATRAFLRASG